MTKSPDSIQPGRNVRMHYAITLSDGTEAVTTFGDEPAEFVVGDGSIDAGLESLLDGLAPGDDCVFHLEPGQAFGQRDESMIHWVPRSDFPPEMSLDAGVLIGFSTPAGDEVAGIVLELDDERVKVDFNHPLAGREIQVRVKILAVATGTG